MTNRNGGAGRADATAESNGSPAPPIGIRRALVGDARAIAEIGVRGWQAAYAGILPDDFLASLSVDPREIAWLSLLESVEEAGAPTWLAEREGRAVGFVSSGPPRDEDVPLPGAEIYAIYVVPEAWRSGAGRALMNAAVGHWRTAGVTTLVLWVLEANGRARSFYESQNWRPDGGRQDVDFGGFAATEIRYRLRL